MLFMYVIASPRQRTDRIPEKKKRRTQNASVQLVIREIGLKTGVEGKMERQTCVPIVPSLRKKATCFARGTRSDSILPIDNRRLIST